MVGVNCRINYLDYNYNSRIAGGSIVKKYKSNLANIIESFDIHKLCATIDRIFGENYSDYLCNVRIETAKELLRNTNETILSIASKIEYKDAKYFSQGVIKGAVLIAAVGIDCLQSKVKKVKINEAAVKSVTAVVDQH